MIGVNCAKVGDALGKSVVLVVRDVVGDLLGVAGATVVTINP